MQVERLSAIGCAIPPRGMPTLPALRPIPARASRLRQPRAGFFGFGGDEEEEAEPVEVVTPKLPSGATMPPVQPESSEPLFGWVENAERINSRAAMIGFIGIMLVEALTGRGILQLVGINIGKGLGLEL